MYWRSLTQILGTCLPIPGDLRHVYTLAYSLFNLSVAQKKSDQV